MAWARLIEPLDKHITHTDDADTRLFERRAGSISIREEKVSNPLTADHPRTTTFNTHSLAAQRGAHFSERARPIIKRNGQILH